MHERWKYCKDLWKQSKWGKGISLIWLLVSVFSLVRDEFFMPNDVKTWRVINMIPHLSLSLWIIVFALIVVIGIFESSFRLEKTKRHLSPLQDQALDLADLLDNFIHCLGTFPSSEEWEGAANSDTDWFLAMKAWEDKASQGMPCNLLLR